MGKITCTSDENPSSTAATTSVVRANGRLEGNNGDALSSVASGAVRMFRVSVEPPSRGTFFSGSEIRGQVVVDTAVARNFKYIHISLTGSAQVRVGCNTSSACDSSDLLA